LGSLQLVLYKLDLTLEQNHNTSKKGSVLAGIPWQASCENEEQNDLDEFRKSA
jgi:hypothetical protein